MSRGGLLNDSALLFLHANKGNLETHEVSFKFFRRV